MEGSKLAEESRSPLKDEALQFPGQSGAEQLRKLIDAQIEQPGIFAIAFVTIAAVEWWRWYAKSPQPIFFTVIAMGAVAYAVWKFYRVRPTIRALRLGIEGERAVGQFLERLRAAGYFVFHDVLGENFNIDHVLIGPAGVITIETKTLSKPRRGDARITFDGEKVLVQGHPPKRNPID